MSSSAFRATVPGTAGLLSLPVIVAALGYFVDIYDLVLIGMVGKASLLGIGIAEAQVKVEIAGLLGLQMIGMFLGGFLWGTVADRYGRLATLFGSIIIYSLATGLNGAVTELWQYQVLRVIAGIGLAGELGTGITLVCEALPRERRALGSTIVASVGIAGAVAGYFIADAVSWRNAFYIGGGLGLGLLVLRWMAHESKLFAAIDASIPKGSLRMLFGSRERILRYLRSIALGLPTWYVVGLFVFMCLSTAPTLGVSGPIKPGLCILWCYLGLIVGDVLAGLLSQRLQSRRKAVLVFLLAGMAVLAFALTRKGMTPDEWYALCGVAGLTVGYWALFVTIAAEQFGTNLRATVATTVPNVARGLFDVMQRVVLAIALVAGADGIPTLDQGRYVAAIIGVGIFCYGGALLALWSIEETHGKDLDYLEELP